MNGDGHRGIPALLACQQFVPNAWDGCVSRWVTPVLTQLAHGPIPLPPNLLVKQELRLASPASFPHRSLSPAISLLTTTVTFFNTPLQPSPTFHSTPSIIDIDFVSLHPYQSLLAKTNALTSLHPFLHFILTLIFINTCLIQIYVYVLILSPLQPPFTISEDAAYYTYTSLAKSKTPFQFMGGVSPKISIHQIKETYLA